MANTVALEFVGEGDKLISESKKVSNADGDLMALYVLLKAGILLKHSYYREVGYQMLLQLNERTDYIKNNLYLCHRHSQRDRKSVV